MIKKKLKICHCASVDMTIRFMLLSRLKFLSSQGYDVYTTCSPGKWVKDIEREGIKVKMIGFKRRPFSLASDIVSFFRLYFYFLKERFDVVHTHTLKPEFFGQIAAKIAGVPVIINTLHGFDFAEEDSVYKKKIIIFLQKIAASCSDLIFSIAHHIIERVKVEKIADMRKLRYIGRDIDTERFNPAKFDDGFLLKKKEQLGIGRDAKVIGIVARMVREKGYVELFEAFKKVVLKFPNSVLLLVGPIEPEKDDAIGPEFIKNSEIEKKVFFVGDQVNVEEFYALMDIFVLPTYREGLGAATLEASSMEKPVVVSNVGGCPETVDDGVTGFLIPAKDFEKLAEKIIFLLENEEIAKAMGKKGREKVVSEFRSEIVFKRIIDGYAGVLHSKGIYDFDAEWFEKYKKAVENGSEEYEIMFSSKKGLKNHLLYFIDNFRSNVASKDLNSKKKVLDIGCGFGYSMDFLKKEGFVNLLGVDYIEGIVGLAKQKFPNLDFRVADIYSLPFENESFDVVLCEGVLQCLSDPEKAIVETKRVMNKKGLLALSTLNSLSLGVMFQKEPLRRYNPFKLKKLLERNGLLVKRMKGIYVLPGFLNPIGRLILESRINRLFDLLFPIFVFFSHSFYIEAIKE